MAVSKQNLDNTDAALIAEKHDRRARKDASLNMRISSDFLEEIKAAAKRQGFDKYQTWVHAVLEEMVANSAP